QLLAGPVDPAGEFRIPAVVHHVQGRVARQVSRTEERLPPLIGAGTPGEQGYDSHAARLPQAGLPAAVTFTRRRPAHRVFPLDDRRPISALGQPALSRYFQRQGVVLVRAKSERPPADKLQGFAAPSSGRVDVVALAKRPVVPVRDPPPAGVFTVFVHVLDVGVDDPDVWRGTTNFLTHGCQKP